MSGKVVGWALEQHTGSPAAKLVLVKLADNAGEEGLCWPSIELIVEHTELGQSTVYKHLAGLEAAGLIKAVELTAGESGVMRGYQLSLPAATEQIPPRRKAAPSIPPSGKEILRGGESIPPDGKSIPPRGIPPTPPYIAEPSIEPSSEPSGEPRARERAFEPSPRGANLFEPDGIVPEKNWAEFVKMRKKMRAPLTDHAADLILIELKKLQAAGHDPIAVIDQSTRNCWRDVFPIREQRNGTNGSGYHERNHSSVIEGTRRALEREQNRAAGGDDAGGPDRGLSESSLDAAGA